MDVCFFFFFFFGGGGVLQIGVAKHIVLFMVWANYVVFIGIWSYLSCIWVANKKNHLMKTACSTGVHLIFAQESTCTIILTLTAREGNFGDFHPKQLLQAISIVLHCMSMKYNVCITSDLQTNDVKWIYLFAFRIPYILKLKLGQLDFTVNLTRTNIFHI